jgi:hypothetical protein
VATATEVLDIEVKISDPDTVFIPKLGATKLDLVRYYLAVMPGELSGSGRRPTTIYRWPSGVDHPPARFAPRGDLWAPGNDSVGSGESPLDLADREGSEGFDDAPWPPNLPKAEVEPPRVQPSRRRADRSERP